MWSDLPQRGERCLSPRLTQTPACVASLGSTVVPFFDDSPRLGSSRERNCFRDHFAFGLRVLYVGMCMGCLVGCRFCFFF